jgi:hypothetical protein
VNFTVVFCSPEARYHATNKRCVSQGTLRNLFGFRLEAWKEVMALDVRDTLGDREIKSRM